MARTNRSAGRSNKKAARRMTTRKAGAMRRATTRMSTRRSMGGRASARDRFEPGAMTVREAGRKGGLIGGKKGGETVKRERGIEFYQEIGRKGGQRVRDLIAAGRRATERPARGRHT